MLLRRIIDHVKEQNWTAVALDFVIVVVGILIAFQITEWSNDRDDRRRERQIVADMLADLEIDRTEYANAIAIAARRVGAANASLQGANLAPVDFSYVNPDADSVIYDDELVKAATALSLPPESLWTDVVIGYFPTASTATYDALVGAGETRIIRDRTLVRAIQSYSNMIGAVARQNDKLTTIRQDTLNAGAKYGLAPYDRLAPNDYYRLIEQQQDLAAAIRISAIFTLFHHGDIRRADQKAAMLQDRLQSFLDDG